MRFLLYSCAALEHCRWRWPFGPANRQHAFVHWLFYVNWSRCLLQVQTYELYRRVWNLITSATASLILFSSWRCATNNRLLFSRATMCQRWILFKLISFRQLLGLPLFFGLFGSTASHIWGIYRWKNIGNRVTDWWWRTLVTRWLSAKARTVRTTDGWTDRQNRAERLLSHYATSFNGIVLLEQFY